MVYDLSEVAGRCILCMPGLLKMAGAGVVCWLLASDVRELRGVCMSE